ncbi:chemotaxis protein CheD [Paenibacillus xylaniclasticus]|uniref:chemotaxis protein CheD n=1 Tax=Paenibacillus xylaniclasticus TaxID=588083 RepID=UPI000FD9F3ED|nr:MULTISPECIES: chemotaxis protein CheD [Paenibacillus]GFN31871.1 chemoreceptor glutamine deamidase CheD [Paenibacillus curdlanolyticus]
MMQQVTVKVGMADMNIATDGALIRTTGLGSCVGVTLYDSVAGIAGMAHIMLPSSEIAKESSFNVAKYADSAVPALIARMEEAGASVKRMVAKLAGGAQMFAFASQSDTMRIGPRNIESCKHALQLTSIPIRAEDTGANYGRTIEMDSRTGILTIRSVQFGIKEI